MRKYLTIGWGKWAKQFGEVVGCEANVYGGGK
jgi:hypothetical protein